MWGWIGRVLFTIVSPNSLRFRCGTFAARTAANLVRFFRAEERRWRPSIIPYQEATTPALAKNWGVLADPCRPIRGNAAAQARSRPRPAALADPAIADPGKAFDAAMALAAKVAAQPPISVAMTRLTDNRLTHALDDLASHMDLDQFALASLTEDHTEGVVRSWVDASRGSEGADASIEIANWLTRFCPHYGSARWRLEPVVGFDRPQLNFSISCGSSKPFMRVRT